MKYKMEVTLNTNDVDRVTDFFCVLFQGNCRNCPISSFNNDKGISCERFIRKCKDVQEVIKKALVKNKWFDSVKEIEE